jgi:hypothetical protein
VYTVPVLAGIASSTSARLNGWFLTPSLCLNQDLADVWLEAASQLAKLRSKLQEETFGSGPDDKLKSSAARELSRSDCVYNAVRAA